MHLFYNASQIKMVILHGRLICHSQFWHLHCQFQSFSRTQSICCSPASVRQNIPIPNEYHMLGSFVRTLPVKFHQLLVRLQKTLMTLAIYTVNRIFLERFYHGWSDHHEIHLPSLHWFPPDTLKMSRMTFYQRNTRHTALRHFDSPSNPCAANWFPCFKEKRHRPVPRVLLLSVRMISNHPTINYSMQMSEIMSLAISFLSCFFFCKRLSE